MSASTVRVVKPSPGMGRSTVRPGQTSSGDIGRMKTSATVGTVVARQPRTSVGPVRTGKPRSMSLVQVVRLSSDRVDGDSGRVGMGTMHTMSSGSTGSRVGIVGVVTGEKVGSGSPELGSMRFAVFVVDGRAGTMGDSGSSMGGRGVVGVGAHQPSSGRVGIGVGVGPGETGSMVGVRPSETRRTGSVVSVTSRQPRARRMPEPSSRMGSPVAGVGMLSSSYSATQSE